jgi:GH25 family lysozyme M1 (1,4-beta-N-acetylmuramidase)
MALRGIDVGSPQGSLSPADWRAIAASGVRWAYLRCGNGNEGSDPTFAANLAGARAAGILVGAYHVGMPLPNDPAHPGRDPESQALAHYRACNGLGSRDGELPPALDFEWPTPDLWSRYGCSAEQILVWGREYLEIAGPLYGVEPVVYSFRWFWDAVAEGHDARAFASSPLWLAAYETHEPIRAIAPWTRATFWQLSDGGGRLPNGARVDEDELLGDDAELAALCRRLVDVTDGGQDRPVHPPIEPEKT